jgi:hypothetical protein
LLTAVGVSGATAGWVIVGQGVTGIVAGIATIADSMSLSTGSGSGSSGVPRPEAGYLGSKKHGIGWKEGPAAAKSLGKPQGQWGSKADLDFAAEKAATLKPGEGKFFDLPPGHSSVVHRPDGTTVPANRIWVRNNGTGTFHGSPWE